MRVEGVLDLHRGDVLATGDDEVLQPIAELDVAVRMQDAQVTGPEPTVFERARGCL